MKTLILVLLAMFALLTGPAAGQEPNANGLGWRWQNPLPQGNDLRDVEVVQGQTVFAVGDDGTIIRTTDGGQSWDPQASNTDADLWGISFMDLNTGIAVGAGGTVVRTADAGQTWNPITISTAGTLRDVKFTDALHGTAVEDLGRIFRTSDGGLTWNPIIIPNSIGLFGVHFQTSLRGIAVGMGGRIFGTTDGGDSWVPCISPTTQPLYAVFFATPSFGVAVGLGGVILRTTDGGDTWSVTSLGALIAFADVAFGDSLHGIAVGLPGINYHTSDGGITWFTRSSGTSSLLWKASFVDAENGYAVGTNGAIMKTADGGVNWESQWGGTTNSLFGVSFADVNMGIAVGDVGTIIRTTNAGTTWIQQGSGTIRTLWSVCLASTAVGTAVGSSGTILRCTNGGVTWLLQASGTTVPLYGVSHSDGNNAMAVGGQGTVLRTTNGGATWSPQNSGTIVALNAVQMVTSSLAYIAGSSGIILKTTNGGSSWTPSSTGTTEILYGLSFSDAATGTAVGAAGTVIHTTDGGSTWMTQSSGTTLTLNSVSFASTTIGLAVGSGGTILHTRNSGVSWSRQSSGTTNSLACVDLVDAGHGTAVGFAGTILYTDTGGDPPAPAFSVVAPSLDFGEVTVGSGRSDSVTVTNTGTALLSITNVESDNSRFAVAPVSALISPGTGRKFTITFTPVSTGPKSANIVFHSNTEGSPDTVRVEGVGMVEGLGRYLSLPPDSVMKRDPLTGKFLKPVKRGKRLYPNWANLVSEVVIQGGFQPGSSQSDAAGAMRVGVSWMYESRPNKWKPRSDSASMRCWVRLGRWNFTRSIGSSWANVQKTLLDNTGIHAGPARGFDSTGLPGQTGRKVLVKQLAKLPPKKQSNRLFAELVALKMNIAASLLGKTPVGFGELEYDREGCICDDLSVVEIAAKVDSMMTLWQGHTRAEYDSLYSVLYNINRAFAGPLDTLSFEADEELILEGSVDLNSVSFLKPGTIPPRRLRPTTDLVTDPDEFGEEEFEDGEGVPVAARLYQNYPNPFNPGTTVSFRLLENSLVTVRIYNMLGQQVATLADGEELEEGYNEIRLDASGLASGVYFCQIEAQGLGDEGLRTVATNKMILLK